MKFGDLDLNFSNMSQEERLSLEGLCRKKQLHLFWMSDFRVAGMKLTPLLRSQEICATLL